MALDTTVGGATSDSYSTLAEWVTYVADFLNEDVSAHGHDTSHEANLRRAGAYLDRTYNWIGERVTITQSMQWPREIDEYVDGFLIPDDEIPTAVKQAQNELAWLLHEGVDLFATVSNGPITKTKVKAGPVETETEYKGTREQSVFVAVEGMLAPYITGKKSTGGLKSVNLSLG